MREVHFKALEHKGSVVPSALSMGFLLGVMVSLYTLIMVLLCKL